MGFLVVAQTPFPCTDEEKIHYVDFTSLYPWTNKYCEVPLGNPEILTSEALVNHPIDDFFGMIKCEILPPSFLFHPLLPYRANGKLMFPLCRTCAENLQQTPCEHSDSKRTLSGTWPSIEIQKACELGYRVVKLTEVISKTGQLIYSKVILTPFLKLNKKRVGGPRGVGQRRINVSTSESTKKKKASS